MASASMEEEVQNVSKYKSAENLTEVWVQSTMGACSKEISQFSANKNK